MCVSRGYQSCASVVDINRVLQSWISTVCVSRGYQSCASVVDINRVRRLSTIFMTGLRGIHTNAHIHSPTLTNKHSQANNKQTNTPSHTHAHARLSELHFVQNNLPSIYFLLFNFFLQLFSHNTQPITCM